MQNMQNNKYIESLEDKISLLSEELHIKDKEVDDLKGAFLANISHEIRTPMNAIVGYSYLLKEQGFSKNEKSEFADEIIVASNHLTDLLEDLIEVSRLQFDKKTQAKREAIDPYKLLFNIFEDYQTKKKALYKGEIELRIKTTTKNLDNKFISNRKILDKILSNLLDNALKFTDKGVIELRVDFYNDYLQFVITDTGIGIPKEKLSAIYNNFSKVWSKNSDVLYDGLGIGLSSVRNFVGILGGLIDVQSEMGKGTRFFVSIPYTKRITLNPEKITTHKKTKKLPISA